MTCDQVERDELLGHLGEKMAPHVEHCGDCRVKRNQYLRLVAALAQESDRPLPSMWKERTLARLDAARLARRRRVALVGGLTAAANAAVILVLLLRAREVPHGKPELTVHIERRASAWRGPARPGDAQPGDVLRVSARPARAGFFELRIYREAHELLVRCGGASAPTCRLRDGDGGVDVAVTLRTVGEYQAIWLVSSSPLPAPAGLDADVRAANRVGARVAASESIHVF